MMHEIDFRNEVGVPYKHIVWLTDLHLDFLYKVQYQSLIDLIKELNPDILLIGGDICNGISCLNHLRNLEKLLDKQIYYVLGNHDFYYGSIAETRASARSLTKSYPKVHYLTEDGVISLSKQTALIGHDGWSDARAGDFLHSQVQLNDYFLIEELKHHTPENLMKKLHELGEQAAESLRKLLIKAFKTHSKVILLTHVPPFEEASVYQGVASDSNWSPHFVGKQTGDVIKSVMLEYKGKELLILCGHSHSSADLLILPNIRVVAGQSEYGIPNIQGLIFT